MGLRTFWRRLQNLRRRGDLADDLNEEMRLHVELKARRLREQGVAEGEAGYMAQRQFGNRALILDSAAEAWGWGAWERLFQDVRLGARTLRKSPGFTVVTVLTLAVGLGINTAIFSVVNAVMIRNLPYPQPDRLVALWEEYDKAGPDIRNGQGTSVGSAGSSKRTAVSVANLVDYRDHTGSFAGLASYDRSPMNLTGNGRPERVVGESVSARFFEVLGVSPAQGRGLSIEDDRQGALAVVVVTHNFWQSRLGGDTGVLQHTLMLDGRAYQIIGVLPKEFRAPSDLALPDRAEFFVPAVYSRELLASHGDHQVNVVGRLKSGVSVKTAQADLDRISAALAKQYPITNLNLRAAVAPLQYDLSSGVRDSLYALLGASGLIVLIACVNVANLLLVRAVARGHESSVRLALGASRFRMVRQFLIESLLLAAAGCGTGLLLGTAMMHVLISMAPATIPQIHSVTMDWRVFAVCAAVALISGLLFGMAPAWQASEAKPVESLRATARSTVGKSQVRWRASLTVAEVALSLILIVGASLLLKSFVRLSGVDLGFQPERVIAMNVNLPNLGYATAAQRLQFFQRLEERVKALPGVQSAAYANRMPMRGGWRSSIEVESAPNTEAQTDIQAVSPGYFETMGIPLLHGRLLTTGDREGAAYVGVVNQAFARQHLQGKDPIGKSLRRSDQQWVQIVGVVNDIRRSGKTDRLRPQVYLPAAQTRLYPVPLADFAVRAAGDPRQLVNAIQEQIGALDKDQPVTNVRTLEEIVSASAAMRRFQTTLLLVFAAVAVGLALIGIFAVLSYAVGQRTSELGIRMALGADPGAILRLVLKQAGVWIGMGVVIGVSGAALLTKYVESMLFDVRITDWQSYAAAVALLAVLAVAAALIPARRGAALDPMSALRSE
jgi:putative ABC transport system permease protein